MDKMGAHRVNRGLLPEIFHALLGTFLARTFAPMMFNLGLVFHI
jgi:hypothetical protein